MHLFSQADSPEASHLCHHPGCCNPEHLIIESRANNIKRNTCFLHRAKGINQGPCECSGAKCVR